METNEETYTCECCGEAVSEDDARYSEMTNATLCEGCEQGDTDHASTLLRFTPNDGHDKMLFGDHTAYHGSNEGWRSKCNLDDYGIPDWARKFWPENWTGRKYQSTDGWRGYYCTGDLFDLHKLETGWATGNWSDVRHKWSFNELVEAMVSGDVVPPATLYILAEPTSNVFSTAITVMCDKSDVDTLERWIAEELGFDLNTSLS